MKNTLRHKILAFCAIASICSFFVYKIFFAESQSEKSDLMDSSQISSLIGDSVRANEFPETLTPHDKKDLRPSTYTLQYTLDQKMQSRMQKLFEQYRPDYGSLVALDAKTGRILAMVSYTKEKTDLGNLALRATFPVASIFKVVTAAAAIDKHGLSPDLMLSYNGGNHTLYRKNVYDNKMNRWTRRTTMTEAFGRSINSVFAKIGLNYLNPIDFVDYAKRFLFNEAIAADFPVEPGSVTVPLEGGWEIAELASGFNKKSTMSPFQGAMIAAAVANDGVMMKPHLVNEVQTENGTVVYAPKPEQLSIVIQPKSAEKLRVLMAETVEGGTSRKSFRDLQRSAKFKNVDFGGKTGSLQGQNPRGKTDWFIGYAISGEQRIAVAAITVNKEKWTVRSTYLARKFMEDYLR